jgi:serine-type D-Ala-D-Ala carboxypeptidase/endopeptidase (penicillin-binding protein 4)
MTLNKFSAFLLPLLVVAACVGPEPLPPAPTTGDMTLEQLMASDEQAAAQSLALGNAEWGYLLVDAASGKVLASRHPDTGFPPASTAKLPTMIAALGILRPTYRFTTQILAQGSLKSGVLAGDIVLAGDGDPLLTAGDLRALTVRIKDIGITSVEGRFIYTSALPVLAEIESTQPATAAYNQGLSGLNIEFNRVTLSRPSGDGAYTSPSEALPLVPDFPQGAGAPYDLPVRAPDRLAALMLQRFAKAEGIVLPDPEPGIPPPGAVSLAQIRSQPLLEIARAGLEYSNNMLAEVVGLSAARALGNSTDTLQGSADTLGVWLEREVTGLSRFATALANHSGLSTESRITPRQMTLLLSHALGQRFDGWRFDSLLSPGGRRDTLRGRFKDPETSYRVWAKSGTMRYIKGLAGYLDAESGRRLVFALFMHDPALRNRLEHDPERFSIQSRRTSSDWRDRTDLFEAALIRQWIKNY